MRYYHCAFYQLYCQSLRIQRAFYTALPDKPKVTNCKMCGHWGLVPCWLHHQEVAHGMEGRAPDLDQVAPEFGLPAPWRTFRKQLSLYFFFSNEGLNQITSKFLSSNKIILLYNCLKYQLPLRVHQSDSTFVL